MTVLASNPRPDGAVANISPPMAQRAGVARGVNVRPGCDDDGWKVMPTVALADGTVVRLLKDGESLRAWYDAIAAAEQSVFLESYIFAPDGTGQAFLDLLCRKAREGVRVYVIYDSFGSHTTPKEMFAKLKEAGGSVQEFHPIWPWRCNYSWRPFNRDHRKLLVIDGKAAGLGGLNIANEYGGSWIVQNEPPSDNLWRDCGIGMEGPAVGALAGAFMRMWMYLARGGRFSRALLSHNLDGSQGPVGILAAVPTMGSHLSKFLSQLLHQARTSIDLTSAYFAPAENLIDALCGAAKRGVQVRLMLPSKTDAHIMLTAARSFYERLMAAGIQIYERQFVRLHAKTLLIDGAVSVLGSTNFDYRSIDYNCELAAVIRSGEFGLQMRRLFEHDMQFSTCINPTVWRHRPIRDRVIQWAVNRSRYLL